MLVCLPHPSNQRGLSPRLDAWLSPAELDAVRGWLNGRRPDPPLLAAKGSDGRVTDEVTARARTKRGQRGDYRLVIEDSQGGVLFDEWRTDVTRAVAAGKVRWNARQLRKRGLRPARLHIHGPAGEPELIPLP